MNRGVRPASAADWAVFVKRTKPGRAGAGGTGVAIASAVAAGVAAGPEAEQAVSAIESVNAMMGDRTRGIWRSERTQADMREKCTACPEDRAARGGPFFSLFAFRRAWRG